jgi:hypothetical protein
VDDLCGAIRMLSESVQELALAVGDDPAKAQRAAVARRAAQEAERTAERVVFDRPTSSGLQLTRGRTR